MIPDNVRLVASTHVLERIVERFDALLPPYGSIRELKEVVFSLVRSGTHLEDWKRVPFYNNAVAIKHGPGTEFFHVLDKKCVIVGQNKIDERRGDPVLILTTAVRNTLYYPFHGSIAFATAGGSRFVNEAKYLASLEVEAHNAYKEKFGSTPAGVWTKSEKYKALEKLKHKEAAKFAKLNKIEMQLPRISSMSTAEQYHINRIALLKDLGLHTKQDDVKMFSHLIELANYQIDRVGNMNATKHLIRYTNSLKALTDED